MTWTGPVIMATARTRGRWSFCGYKWWSNRTSLMTSPRYNCYDFWHCTTTTVIPEHHNVHADLQYPTDTVQKTDNGSPTVSWVPCPVIPCQLCLKHGNLLKWNWNQVAKNFHTDLLISLKPKHMTLGILANENEMENESRESGKIWLKELWDNRE